MDSGLPSFSPGFSCPDLLRYCAHRLSERLRGFHALRRRFPHGFASSQSPWCRTPVLPAQPYNPGCATAGALHVSGLGSRPVRSPLLRVLLSLPPATEMFQLAGCPPAWRVMTEVIGLPHSEIRGSQPACGSPRLIGAVPRPSSARSARASIVCSSCLPSTVAAGAPFGTLLAVDRHLVSGAGGPHTVDATSFSSRQLSRYGEIRPHTEMMSSRPTSLGGIAP